MIADSLGLPYETKRLLPKRKYVAWQTALPGEPGHLDLNHSDPLTPPWPELIITAGRRHAMAALWIKAQNPATKIVLLGRPRRWIEKFDLVIALPQYQIPDLPNVMRLSLPLMRPEQGCNCTAKLSFGVQNFECLKKPIIAVLVGGPTRPYRFDRKVASELITQCKKMQDRYGGTLYFSTSRRTPEKIVSALADDLPEGSVLHKWAKGRARKPLPGAAQISRLFYCHRRQCLHDDRSR